MTRDPDRLSDDGATPELARALREARGEVLSADAVERVRAGLLATGLYARPPASMGAPQGSPHSVALSPLSPTAKLFGAVAIKVGLASLGLAALVLTVRIWPAQSHDAPASSARASVSAAVESPTPAEPAAMASAALPVASSQSGSGLLASSSASAPASPATTAVASAARAIPARDKEAREGALLLQARRKLDSDPAGALELVRKHEKEFPRSQLAPERATIAALAKKRLEE